MGTTIRMIGMTMLRRFAVVACLGAPMVAGADVPVHNVLDEVGDGSAAPMPYGWQLPPDDAGVWTSVVVDGEVKAFELSRFFDNGVALGKSAAQFEHGPDGAVIGGDHGPAFRVYLDGLLAVDSKAVAPPAPEDLNALRATPLDALPNVPDLFAPRWGDTEPYTNGEACPDANKSHAVYFYATELDANAPPNAPQKMMITWHEVLPAGGCDEGEANSFQLIVTALPGATQPAGRSAARVEYRYGDCGWAVPPQAAAEPEVVGARSGLLFDSAGIVGGEARRAIEVLGAREEVFGTIDGGRLNEGRERGASGDPTQASIYCQSSNLPADARINGAFGFELGDHGRLVKDADFDGVADRPDGPDNCSSEGDVPGVANPYQNDADGDLRGDACDGDVDGDDFPNVEDLCIWVNDNGQDLDRDGVGDACDPDPDGDDIDTDAQPPNPSDNCPFLYNPGQLDLDGDGKGTLCDLADRLEDPSDARLFLALLKGTRDVLVSLDTSFAELSNEVIDLIRALPSDSKLAGTSQTFTVVDVWAQDAKVAPDTVRAAIASLSHWTLVETERGQFHDLGSTANTSDAAQRLKLFEDWATSKMPLGQFAEKYGWTYLKGTD